MTTYELPPDPKHALWDRCGNAWTYDETQDRYNCKEIYIRDCQWHDLLNKYGPLTDTRTPAIGEEFIVSSSAEGATIECPDHAVYMDQEGEVLQETRGHFYTPGYPSVFDGLWPGTWRRIA